tara:strand:- start:420 stop:662 length:243 start_codon:yes stop_codon:yes gene_type:complete
VPKSNCKINKKNIIITDIALDIITLRPIYVFFGALVANPPAKSVGTETLKGRVIKKTIHQIKINNKNFVNKYIKLLEYVI